MSDLDINWHTELIDALVNNRPDSIITRHIDSILQWLSDSKTLESKQISQSIENQGVDELQLKSSAFVLLEVLLFTNVNNPYHVFAAKDGTPPKKLKTRYQRLMKVYHPDLGRIGDIKKRTSISEIINKAYNDIKHNKYKPEVSYHETKHGRSTTHLNRPETISKHHNQEQARFTSPSVGSILDPFKHNPDATIRGMKKIFLGVAGLIFVFFMFTLLSNPAEETVNNKFEQYIKQTVENKANENLDSNEINSQTATSAHDHEGLEEELTVQSEAFDLTQILTGQPELADSNIERKHTSQAEIEETSQSNQGLVSAQSLQNTEPESTTQSEAIESNQSVTEPVKNLTAGSDNKAARSNDVTKAVEVKAQIKAEVETVNTSQELSEKSEPAKTKSTAEVTIEVDDKSSVTSTTVLVPNYTEQATTTAKTAVNSNKTESSKKAENTSQPKVNQQQVDQRSKLLLALSLRQKAEKNIKETIAAFESYYRQGDSTKLASLYAATAKENQYVSRDLIQQVYAEYFSELKSQNIDFSINKIKELANGQYFVSGNFIGSRKKGLFKTKNFNSTFTMQLQSVNGKMKILQMNY